MQAYGPTSTQDKYIYYFSNVATEDKQATQTPPINSTSTNDLHNTSDSTEPTHSTASEFMAICDLDLNPILELRSTNAQIALSEFSVDNLPLCFLHTEAVHVSLLTPLPSLTSNRVMNSILIEKHNETPYRIEFTDFTAESVEAPLGYLNNMLGQRLNAYLIFHLSLAFFDLNLFVDDTFHKTTNDEPSPISGNDIQLLLKYTNCTLHKRAQIHNILARVTPHDRLSTIIKNAKPPLTREFEKNHLSSSSCLRSLPDRQKEDTHNLSISQFEHYYDISLTTSNSRKTELEEQIDREFVQYLRSVWIDLSDLSEDDNSFIDLLAESNLTLIKQGETLKNILTVEYQRVYSDLPDSLFTNQFFTLELDQSGSKCRFRINNKKFLPPGLTELTMKIDPYATYRLGGDAHLSHITIGPITHNSDCDALLNPKHTHNISSSRQRLPATIRYQPRLIRFFTDLIATSDIIYQWTRQQDDDHSGFRVLHTLQICESMIHSRFLFKGSDTLTFHKLLRSANNFRQLSVLLLDENQCKVYFPYKSYCHASLVIQSTSTNY